MAGEQPNLSLLEVTVHSWRTVGDMIVSDIRAVTIYRVRTEMGNVILDDINMASYQGEEQMEIEQHEFWGGMAMLWAICISGFLLVGAIEEFSRRKIKYFKDKHHDIQAGLLPAQYGRHIIEQRYEHRFDSTLFYPVTSMALVYAISPMFLESMGITTSTHGYGTIITGLFALPLVVYVWFLRAYERDRELLKEEANLWSGEFNGLLAQAAKNGSSMQLTAVRQLQDYLSGAKWKVNQASNSTAIFQLYSNLISPILINLQSAIETIDSDENEATNLKAKLVSEARENQIINVIGATLRSAFGRVPPKVINNNLSELDFSLLDLKSLSMGELVLNGSTFIYSELNFTNLTGADLMNANLMGARLRNVDLAGADLMNANLMGADLMSAKLSAAHLISADFTRTDLMRADLSSADLSRADLSGANLSGANLSGANLTDAILSGAHLTGANLAAADLIGANLSGANLWA